jgi:large subunit ribosomal protein L5e
MPFVKVVKNKAYFKRYQTKFRRRREGKTDYYARKRLVMQDKNKYQTPKYRLVVRFTNSQVIAQVVYSELNGDKVVSSAYSSELKKRYGLKAGLKNYAAAYATGLLLARRTLTKLGLADTYEGNTEVTGEIATVEDDKRTFYVANLDDEKRPFRVLLDVGIRPTTTGARLFGALKGASDGGLDIPHNEKRFPGYDREAGEYSAEVHKARIFGEHVAEYMGDLADEDPEKYQAHFSQYIAAGLNSDNLTEMYEAVHAAIRADPTPAAKAERTFDKKYQRKSKRSLKQFKDRVAQKKAARAAKLAAELAA